jgi:prevent-host-death family protein
MKKTNLKELKENLSEIINRATEGEEIIICKNGNPVAKIVALNPKKKPRVAGAWEGKGKIAKDFDKLPRSIMKYFE